MSDEPTLETSLGNKYAAERMAELESKGFAYDFWSIGEEDVLTVEELLAIAYAKGVAEGLAINY